MDLLDIVRYAGALLLVLALVGAAGFAVRRFGLPGVAGKGKRLAVVESLMLGPKHRLYLLRCDSVEHIVILGPNGATLVDSAAADPLPVPEAGVSA
jgi:flagellar protein FliO/FliZ